MKGNYNPHAKIPIFWQQILSILGFRMITESWQPLFKQESHYFPPAKLHISLWLFHSSYAFALRWRYLLAVPFARHLHSNTSHFKRIQTDSCICVLDLIIWHTSNESVDYENDHILYAINQILNTQIIYGKSIGGVFAFPFNRCSFYWHKNNEIRI